MIANSLGGTNDEFLDQNELGTTLSLSPFILFIEDLTVIVCI